ncbi:MAG: cytochrome c-type biogenesis protein CcmH/NrfG [Paracoccaceae bacterium]|jgi:cytochrome c-type biogenesis protein CcmH/NrfG
MQSSIAPPLMMGLLSGAAAAVVTVMVGGGWLLALGAYSLVGASGLIASAFAIAPAADNTRASVRRKAESARHEMQAPPGMVAAKATAGARRAD